MEEKKCLFICNTYYHILIAIIKALLSGTDNSIFICNSWNDRTIFNDSKFIERLKKANIFRNMICFDIYREYSNLINIEKKINNITKYYIIKDSNKKLKDVFSIFDKVYLFNDTTFIGRIINLQNIKYYLIEDGIDCYKNNKNIIISKNDLYHFFRKKILNMPDMGCSKNVINIEVNDKNDIFIHDKNIIELPRKELFSRVSSEDKKKIIDIFTPDLDYNDMNNLSLLITQPFYQDKLIDSEAEQIKLYQNIVDKYFKNDNFIIKTHPRERINYNKIISNNKMIIIKEKFPIEVLNFIPNLKFNKVITISSTSIGLINNCEEKITLGWDYIDNFFKGEKYGL